MTLPEWAPFTISVVGLILMIAGTGLLVRRSLVKAHNTELTQLAETRRQALNDRDERILALEERVTKMEGMMEAMEALKAKQIAEAVVEGLLESGILRSQDD